MHEMAISELKKDWEAHVAKAAKGDIRCGYAAAEVLTRLEQLGCDADWIEKARSQSPITPTGKEDA